MATIETVNNKNGTTSYRVKIRRKGYKPVSKTFKRKTDANKYVRMIETDMDVGRQIVTPEASKYTLSHAIDRYIETILPRKPKSIKKQTTHLNWWRDEYGHMKLIQINAAIVSEARDKLSSETTVRHTQRSPATVNRYMAVLSHLFTIAVKEWEWVEQNPVNKVSKLRESRGRVRFLNQGELKRLLAACKSSKNPYLYPVVFLALSTGGRRNEIMTLTRDDIDMTRRLIIFRETKNDTTRSVPITDDAYQVLADLFKIQRLDTRLLFPSKIYPHQPIDIRKAWERAIKDAKIENFVFHDLRHTCASYLSMNGCSSVEIATILGHKQLSMVKRYSHLAPSHVATVVERMNKAMFR